MSLISFAGSMLLHVIVVWIYHRYKHRNNATPLWCGLFCPKKSRTAVEPEQSNGTQLSVVDTAPREYSQLARLARTISLSQQTLNQIATDAATETLKRTMSHASAPRQADTHYTYRAADVPEHYKSHGAFAAIKSCTLNVFFPIRGKGTISLNFSRGSFLLTSFYL